MKAIVLAAGRGTRLLPLTERMPKCLLPLRGRSVLGWQLEALRAAGVREVVVVTGFGHELVAAEARLRSSSRLRLRTVHNPLYDCSDNLVSCLVARDEMDDDFLLVNGDTLFEPDIVRRLVSRAGACVSVAVVHKDSYDDDDMKVLSSLGWLDDIGKHLDRFRVDGEAIGLSFYHGDGPRLFAEALVQVLRRPDGAKRWYLSAVEALAQRGLVRTSPVDGLDYAEIDCRDDLLRAKRLVDRWPLRFDEPQAQLLRMHA